MKKFTLLLLACIMSLTALYAQQNNVGSAPKEDTITSIPCIYNYTLSYDNLMFIPDGPNCDSLAPCYLSSITFTQFLPGETVLSASDIRSICMKIEHSYLGDLQFKMVCPNGQSVVLHSQPNGGSLFLGVPVDDTGGCNPFNSPMGQGWNYCWSNSPEFNYHGELPNYLHMGQSTSCDSTNITGNSNYYKPMNSFNGLIGCPLNGTWSLEICDLYGIDDGWIWNWSMSVKNMDTSVTGGVVYYDQNSNCQRDLNEFGLWNKLGLIQPGGIYVQTNQSGVWQIDSLPAGEYSITMDTASGWFNPCNSSQSFTIIEGQATQVPCIGLYSSTVCEWPLVNIFAPSFRPCFSNQAIYVSAQNLNIATSTIDSAFVTVHLDTMLQVIGASLPYETISPNTYKFYVGDLLPGEVQNFQINTTVNCAVTLGQSLCMSAEIGTTSPCTVDTSSTPIFPDGVTPCTLPWDHSSLSVIGWCANDSIHFRITNTGSPSNGNMQCYSPVRVYVDETLTYFDSIMIAGGQYVEYVYPGNGQTWIIQADQHPLHPGNSHPTAHVEACGNLDNWTPGIINEFPLDDETSYIDHFCREASGSYDPNIKIGYPYGIGETNKISANQPLQYAIHFQNTGTDTAFTVVIRDTLDVNLNIFSVVPTAASHPYTFRIYGQRVLEWTFNNILLPDSNINEPASKGFATFTVNQNPDLMKGTRIYNKADIYFDYNLPITTNETNHTIDFIQTVLPAAINSYSKPKDATIYIYPNPVTNEATLIAPSELIGETYTLINFLGQSINSGKITQQESKINLSAFPKGVYLLKIGNSGKLSIKIIKN